jgi:protein-S-isoprenylcysteine O-methyltransferase Ste14
MDPNRAKRTALIRFLLGPLVMGGIFFGTAGTLSYWEAWVYLPVVFLPMALAVAYFIRRDPELLRRRMEAKEERARQRTLQKLGGLLWAGIFLLPGFDHRFGWSEVPVWVAIAGNLLVLSGYGVVLLTLKENSYASRTIKVEQGQSVVTTGVYALVRHPMYVGAGLMLLASPLALGSYWALVPTVAIPPFLVLRIMDEEKVLLEELPGYREYTQGTRFRLIPGVW